MDNFLNASLNNDRKFYLMNEFKFHFHHIFADLCKIYDCLPQSKKILDLVLSALEKHPNCAACIGSSMYENEDEPNCRKAGHRLHDFPKPCGTWKPICEVDDGSFLIFLEKWLQYRLINEQAKHKFIIRCERIELEVSGVRRLQIQKEKGKWVLYIYVVPLVEWIQLIPECQDHFLSQCSFVDCNPDLAHFKEKSPSRRADLVSWVDLANWKLLY